MESYEDVINKDWTELCRLLHSIDGLIESADMLKAKITSAIYENISDSEQKAIFKDETYHYEARLVCLAGLIEYFHYFNMFLRSFLVITHESKQQGIPLKDRYTAVYCKMENKHWILPEPNAFIRRIVIVVRAQLLSMPHAQLDELFKQLSNKLSDQPLKISQFSKTLPYVLEKLWSTDQEKQTKMQSAFKKYSDARNDLSHGSKNNEADDSQEPLFVTDIVEILKEILRYLDEILSHDKIIKIPPIVKLDSKREFNKFYESDVF